MNIVISLLARQGFMTKYEFKAARIAIGYKTRPQVAFSIGVKPQTVKGWESGRSPVPGYAVEWLRRSEHDYAQKARK